MHMNHSRYNLIAVLLLALLCVAVTACDDNIGTPDEYVTRLLRVQVSGDLPSKQDISVRVTDDKGMVFSSLTDADGEAIFHVPVGIYESRCRMSRSPSMAGARCITVRLAMW